MIPFHVALFVVSLFAQDSPAARHDCREYQECRQLALDAAGRQEYETFHDFAWRAIQKGPKNDPSLMYLLARAQSLSGRPGDALVTLQRLAQMGIPTDAETNDDFRRVRALPAWADWRNASGATPSVSAEPPPEPAPVRASREPEPPSPKPNDRGEKARAAVRPSPAASIAPAINPKREEDLAGRTAPAATATATRPGLTPAESLRFTTAPFTPAGLAYDGVSRRFIVGDRDARKLAVVDEFSQHVANLASAQSAGFGSIAALEIDPRQGNLWVVSALDNGTADSGAGRQTMLHKLQLVSGRVLSSYTLPERFGAAAFVDVAAAPDSTVVVLDQAGHRVFRLRPKSQELELAAMLGDEQVVSIAPGENTTYVATSSGITIVDSAGRSSKLSASPGIDLTHITRLRWYKGSLVGIQQAQHAYCAVRIALDTAGRRARSIQILDPSLPTSDPTAATVAGGVLYYLASGEGSELIVRKVVLP